MKVSELIEELQKMPQDWEVNIRHGSTWVFPYKVEARQDRQEKVVIIMDRQAAGG